VQIKLDPETTKEELMNIAKSIKDEFVIQVK